MARCSAALVSSLLCGCVFSMGDPPVDSSRKMMGSEGGVVSLQDGPSLSIPAGALFSPTEVSIVRLGVAAPAGALSALYEFRPDQTSFAQPASVSFPVPAGVEKPVVYWSRASGAPQYDRLDPVLDGGIATAKVTHLGVGYLAGAPRATRTVSGALSTVYWQDDGTKTSRNGILAPPMRVSAIFVPNGHGYDRLPISPNADSSFSVGGVPAGSYLLQLDTIYPPNAYQGEAVFSQLVELTTSTPDLSMVMAARPTVRSPGTPTQVTLNLMNLTPWVRPAGDFSGDMILIAGSQAHVYSRPQISGSPPAGVTSWTHSFPWDVGSTADFIGLPEAAQGDVEFVYQRSSRNVGSGASLGMLHWASRFQRIDNLTLVDGVPGVLDVTLQDVPQTGQLRADLRNGQFAALAQQVNPHARPSAVVGGGGVSILSVPHTVEFPDAPAARATSSVLWLQGPVATDVDYGVLTYGQLPAPLWQEERYATYTFEIDVPTPSGSTYSWTGGFLEFMRAGSTGPIAPALLPPAAPRINGRDGFIPQTGAGLQPTISWSSPASGGAPTSYLVRIDLVSQGVPPPGLQEVAIAAYTSKSVQVPGGFLQAGNQYVATITAVSASWDTLDRPPLRSGTPLRMADCVTAVFSP